MNPVCPKATGDSRVPAELPPVGVSHPSARRDTVESCRRVKVATADESKNPHAVEDAVAQVHPREACEIPSG